MIQLGQLLLSRDTRVAFQHELLESHPGCTLVCLTVQLPGAEKRTADSLTIARAGVEALSARFPGCLVTEKDLETGYEAYFLVSMEAADAKRETCALEQSHPLGRLMDIDVIGPNGAISREEIGLEPRRCLLCENEVRYCMRARNHTVRELLDRIHQMVNQYNLCNTEN